MATLGPGLVTRSADTTQADVTSTESAPAEVPFKPAELRGRGEHVDHHTDHVVEPVDHVDKGLSERWVLTLSVLIVGMFLSVLDVSIMNVALPSIQHAFGSGVNDTQWIITAYSLTLGVIVPASGWLGDRFGLGRTYNVSLVAFALCSGLCGLAWDLPSLVFFRILQAIPGGILPVITLTMVYKLVPKEKLGIAMAMYGVGVVFAPAIGPTLGGYLVEYHTWHWIFLINVPIGLVGAALGLHLLRGSFRGVPVGRFDVPGFLSVAGGLFALLLALSKGQEWGWYSYPVMILICFGVLSLAVFVVIELDADEPLLDVRLFAVWQFTNSLLLIVALSLGLFAMLLYVPLFMQESLGATPFHTGLIMLPEAVAMVCILPVAGMMYDAFGPKLPSAIGLAIAAYGTYLMCGISVDMTARDVVLWTWIRGIGNGLAMVPIMTAGLAMVPAAQLNQASAINNAVQRITGALGLAVIAAFASSRNPPRARRSRWRRLPGRKAARHRCAAPGPPRTPRTARPSPFRPNRQGRGPRDDRGAVGHVRQCCDRRHGAGGTGREQSRGVLEAPQPGPQHHGRADAVRPGELVLSQCEGRGQVLRPCRRVHGRFRAPPPAGGGDRAGQVAR